MLMKKAALFIAFCISIVVASAQPAFKGGNYALNNFLSAKIIYPEYSRQNCIGGTVQVSFMLDEKGNVNGAKIQQGMGIDLDDEALRVIKLTSGQWTIPDNYDAGTRIVLPVKFTPDAQRCSGVHDQGTAIEAYKNRQELEKVVTTYYKKQIFGQSRYHSRSQDHSAKKTIRF
jgi:TonB family protein